MTTKEQDRAGDEHLRVKCIMPGPLPEKVRKHLVERRGSDWSGINLAIQAIRPRDGWAGGNLGDKPLAARLEPEPRDLSLA